MRFIKDPTCPGHPKTEVYLWTRSAQPPVWICSACRRLLGAAALSGLPNHWPQHRQPVIADLGMDKVDWRWRARWTIFARGARVRSARRSCTPTVSQSSS